MKDIFIAVIIAILLNLLLPPIVIYTMKPSKNQLQNEALAMMKHHDETKFMSSIIVAVIVAISMIGAKIYV